MEPSKNNLDQDNATIVREGKKVFAFVSRGNVYVKERVPLHVVDKWDEEKKTWYLVGVAKRLKRDLDKAEENHRRKLEEAQKRYIEKKLEEQTKDGQANSQQTSGSEQASSD